MPAPMTTTSADWVAKDLPTTELAEAFLNRLRRRKFAQPIFEFAQPAIHPLVKALGRFERKRHCQFLPMGIIDLDRCSSSLA